MKKILTAILVASVMVAATGCTSNNTSSSTPSSNTESSKATNSVISVISREDGSGTRGAFVEIVGILEDKVDKTTVDAIIHDGTGKVMTAVSESPNAVGYISLGSLNETVKAVKIEGAVATAENVKNGSYKIARPFIIGTKGEAQGISADLIKFIMSKEGQEIVGSSGFIANDEGTPFTSSMEKGSIVIGGSTSVYPLMEKLVEAYNVINPNADISIEGVGSSAGTKGAQDGTFDIGMVSRELTDSEAAALSATTIALDGIAVIVNSNNPVDNLTLSQVKLIYKGEVKDWAEVK